MNKKIITRIILIVAYCIPFVFLALHGDATSGTMSFYAIMVLGFAILCWFALKTDNVSIIVVGNILSTISSYLFWTNSRLGPMEWYFKPLTAHSMLVAISVIAFACQMIAVIIHKKQSAGNQIEEI